MPLLSSFIKKIANLRKGTKVLLFLCVVLLLSLIAMPLMGLTVTCPLIKDVSTSSLSIEEKTNYIYDIEGYNRPEESTYLTFPEWHLVYIPDEYANWIESEKPSKFPYFRAISQFWKGYCNVYEITKKQYDFNVGNHFMLWVIGASSTIEFGVKGIYENSLGKVTEEISYQTEEDKFAYELNKEYADFLYDVPWYEFSFASKLKDLWTEIDFFGPDFLRKIERRKVLTLELAAKTVYGGIIKLGTRMLYGKAPLEIYASIENVPENLFIKYPEIKEIRELDNGSYIIKMPRYRKFTELVPQMAKERVRFIEIAGNDDIFITILAPNDWSYNLETGDQLFSMQLLTEDKKRLGIKAEVKSLHLILPELERQGVKIEHLYDY